MGGLEWRVERDRREGQVKGNGHLIQHRSNAGIEHMVPDVKSVYFT